MTERPDSLPPLMDAATAARQIWRLLRQDNGVTFSLYFGSLTGQDLYALSVFPEREIVDDVDVSADNIEAFILDNLDLLSDPNHSVGIWLEGDDCYLDVSLTVRGKEEAIDLARAHHQLAICHLADITIQYIEPE